MVDVIYNIFEDDFNKNLTHAYNLSILISTERLSYLISNQQQQVVALRSYQLSDLPSQKPLKQLLLEDSILRDTFRTVKIGLFTPRFTLVPLPLFDASFCKNYLNATNQMPRTDKVLFDQIQQLDMVNVYGFDQAFINDLSEYFPAAVFYHASTGLLHSFVQKFDSTESKNLHLNIQGPYISITVTENKAILFHNIFTYKASPDCLYYVLLVCKQLGLHPGKCLLNISGELVEASEIHKLLYKYIKKIHFVPRPGFYLYGEKLKEVLPPNLFFDLFSLKLCE